MVGMEMIEVDSSQKGTGTAQRQQAQAAAWDIVRRSEETFLLRMFTFQDGPRTFTFGETSFNWPCCGLQLYWMSSRGLFHPTLFKDSVDLLCLKLILTFFTVCFTCFFLKSKSFVIDFIKKMEKINQQEIKHLNYCFFKEINVAAENCC